MPVKAGKAVVKNIIQYQTNKNGNKKDVKSRNSQKAETVKKQKQSKSRNSQKAETGKEQKQAKSKTCKKEMAKSRRENGNDIITKHAA